MASNQFHLLKVELHAQHNLLTPTQKQTAHKSCVVLSTPASA